MKMKASTCAILALCATLFCCSLSSISSTPFGKDFSSCLSTLSDTSCPNIFTPNNASFSEALQSYQKNLRFSTPRTPKPRYIVVALHESHVQATVVCAKRHGLQLRSLSSGHDYEGLSYVSNVSFVVLDVSRLREITINMKDETAWVQAGATTGEVYYRISQASKVHAFPAGVCLTLGAGGHFSGGGYGPLMRKYGLSIDNIIDARVVDVNGKILNRRTMGEDFFWAIRGGGAASFGVILAWRIKLVKVPKTVTVFNVPRTLEQGGTDIAYKWQLVAPRLPKELFIRVMPQVRNATNGKTIEVSFIGHFLGNPKNLLPILKKSFPELGLEEKDCVEMSWVNSTLSWMGIPVGTPLEEALLTRSTGGSLFKSKSDYVKKPFSKKTLNSIWKQMIKIENMWMQWNPYGGRMDEIPESATAFPHRAGNLFLIQHFTFWSEEKDTNFYLSAARKYYDFMAPFVSRNPRETFLNYRDIDIGSNPSNVTNFDNARVYGSKYFKDNFERFVRVKSKVDPDNFFKNEQSIPPLPIKRSKLGE